MYTNSDWLMTKLRLLLLTLTTALAVTACSGDATQDTAVPTAEESATAAATQPAAPTAAGTADAGQEKAAGPEQGTITPEIQATEPLPTQAPAPTDTTAAAFLPVLGPAPGWDNDVWINTETPLPLEDLRGKVVLLEFWTFG